MVYWLLGAFLLAFAVLFWWWPTLLVRLPLWIICHTVYRIRARGRENVPRQGPALFVCNHVGYWDWLFLLASQPRFLHFVIFAGWTKKFGLRHIFKWAGVIPIDKSSGPRAIIQSLRLAGEALARGEAVCIFAEGRFTRTGFLLPFHRGLEQIVKNSPAPIIPVCLEQVWGSIFSYYGNKLIWKWPQVIPYPVTVAFGAPLPPTTPAADVRQAVQKLSADCAVERSACSRPPHRQFVRRAARHPFRTCLIDKAREPHNYSYGRVLVDAILLARQLKPQLVSPGAPVGLWLPPGYWSMVGNIALAMLGKVAANLSTTWSSNELDSATSQADIRQILTTRSFTNSVPLGISAQVAPLYLDDVATASNGQRFLAWCSVLFLPGVVLERLVLRLGKHRPADLLTVVFAETDATSSARGVRLCHANIAANVESLIQVIDLRAADRVVSTLPWSGAPGYTTAFWLPLHVGATIVLPANPQNAKSLGETCRRCRGTALLAIPHILQACLTECAPTDFASLRFLWTGAQSFSPELARQFADKFGIEPLTGYGRTELSPVAAINVPNRDLDGFRQIGNKPGTVGQPLPGVAAQVVDPVTFAPVPAGQNGLLLIYGANITPGYVGIDSKTGIIRNGWFVTGQTASLDEDGFLTIA